MNTSQKTATLLSILVLCLYSSYTQAIKQSYVAVDCYKDSASSRALPDLIANYRIHHPVIDWSNLNYTISACAQAAQAKGYIYFAVQFWGECWAGRSGHLTYDKHGPSTECEQGVGKSYTNFVYRNTGVDNECYSPKILDSPDRAMSYQQTKSAGYKCDNNLVEGWYRFQGGAGNAFANTCVAKLRCATLVQGWLEGSQPEPRQGIAPGKVCYQYQGDCCRWHQQIQVRNCGRFYVYKLKQPTYGCYLRYCGNGK